MKPTIPRPFLHFMPSHTFLIYPYTHWKYILNTISYIPYFLSTTFSNAF